MLKVVQEDVAADAAGGAAGSMLDEIVRDGARQMLASALQAEVAAYVQAHAGQVDERGHRLVVRNGSALAREVVTGAGAVTVAAPRVNDRRVDPVTGVRQRFSSAIVDSKSAIRWFAAANSASLGSTFSATNTLSQNLSQS